MLTTFDLFCYYFRWFQSPLRQFGVLPGTVLMNLEGKGGGGSEGIGRLLDMDAGEVGALCHNHRMGDTVRPPPPPALARYIIGAVSTASLPRALCLTQYLLPV